MHHKTLLWIAVPLAVTTFIFGTIYAVGQQILRQNANDPQIQLAEDTARMITAGENVSLTLDLMNPFTDLNVFYTTMTHDDHKILTTNSTIRNASMPLPPQGVFDWVDAHGEDRFTWETKEGARFATVVVPYGTKQDGGYVIAARNLRDVEAREALLAKITAAGWICSMLVLLGGTFAWRRAEE